MSSDRGANDYERVSKSHSRDTIVLDVRKGFCGDFYPWSSNSSKVSLWGIGWVPEFCSAYDFRRNLSGWLRDTVEGAKEGMRDVDEGEKG